MHGQDGCCSFGSQQQSQRKSIATYSLARFQLRRATCDVRVGHLGLAVRPVPLHPTSKTSHAAPTPSSIPQHTRAKTGCHLVRKRLVQDVVRLLRCSRHAPPDVRRMDVIQRRDVCPHSTPSASRALPTKSKQHPHRQPCSASSASAWRAAAAATPSVPRPCLQRRGQPTRTRTR